MCGRFAQIYSVSDLVSVFPHIDAEWFTESYNIAPSQNALAIFGTHPEKQCAKPLKWGIRVESENSKSFSFINLRSESFFEKSFAKRYMNPSLRVVIPVSGFYEWRAEGKKKRPFYVRAQGKDLFYLAGVADRKTKSTFAVVTLPSAGEMRSIHHRMPAGLDSESVYDWIETGSFDKDFFRKYYKTEVSDYVNSFKNNSAECIKPVNSF